jgi:hypothetical protein
MDHSSEEHDGHTLTCHSSVSTTSLLWNLLTVPFLYKTNLRYVKIYSSRTLSGFIFSSFLFISSFNFYFRVIFCPSSFFLSNFPFFPLLPYNIFSPQMTSADSPPGGGVLSNIHTPAHTFHKKSLIRLPSP